MSESKLLHMLLEPGGLRAVFQPIFDVSAHEKRLHSLECLIRGPVGSNLEKAPVLFEYVRRKREESLIDRACISTALRAAACLPWEPRLSVNVHASTLGRDQDFPLFLSDAAALHALSLDRLTVEIVEHTPYWDGPAFLRSLDAMRAMGVRLALDDIGLGQSNYRMILDCRPEYFKIDRYFVHGCHDDPYRRAVLESIVHLADKFGARIVAEGVEQEKDFRTVKTVGIDLVQGFLLSSALTPEALMESDFVRDELLVPVS